MDRVILEEGNRCPNQTIQGWPAKALGSNGSASRCAPLSDVPENSEVAVAGEENSSNDMSTVLSIGGRVANTMGRHPLGACSTADAQ